MQGKLGHFEVVKNEGQLLRLERRSDLPLIIVVLAIVLLILVWFLRPWQSSGGLVASVTISALVLGGVVAVAFVRPWKEVLIFDHLAGQMAREVRYLLRPSKVMHLPLDDIVEVHRAQRTVRVIDRKGETFEHAYWAALLRTTSGEEIEVDGANDREKIRALVTGLSQFLARPAPPGS